MDLSFLKEAVAYFGADALKAGATALLGLLVGASVTYFAQTRLENRKRRDAEKHLAYAFLVQVAAAAEHLSVIVKTCSQGIPHLVEAGVPQSPDFQHADFVCALLGDQLRTNKAIGELVDGPFDPKGHLAQTLSGLAIAGKDLALLPRAAIAAHQSAAINAHQVSTLVTGIIAMVRNDRALVRDDHIRAAWEAMKKLGRSLERLQLELSAVVGAKQKDVLALREAAAGELAETHLETQRSALAMPQAALAVQRYLAERNADKERR